MPRAPYVLAIAAHALKEHSIPRWPTRLSGRSANQKTHPLVSVREIVSTGYAFIGRECRCSPGAQRSAVSPMAMVRLYRPRVAP
jgi:hypothetical protein